MLGAFVGQFLPTAGGAMTGPIEMGGSNIEGGGTATFTTFVGGLTGHSSLDLLASNNLSDLGSAAAARSNLQLGTAATVNTGTANGDVPVISGGFVSASIIPTLNQNTTGAAANVTGTVAITNGGTGATSAAAALTSLGALATAGGNMTGSLGLGGNEITNLNGIFDNQSPPVLRIDTGGSGGDDDTLINDSTGTNQIDVSTSGVEIINALTVDNGARITGTMHVTGTTSLAGATTFSNTFKCSGYTSPSILYVDTKNTSSHPDGSFLNPYKAISNAISVAVSGDLILVSPGTYTATFSEGQLVLPSGVSLCGCGMDVTTLQPTDTFTAGLAGYLIPGNNSVIRDLTVNLANATANRPPCIGANSGASSGSTQTALNFSLYRVRMTSIGVSGASNAFNYSGNSSSNNYVYMEDCKFYANERCAEWSSAGTGTFTVDAVRCQFWFSNFTGASNTNIGECVFAQASPTRLFDCILSMTDANNTSWSGLGYQCIDADAPLEIYNCKFLTSFPNQSSSPPLTTTAGSNPGYWALSNTNLTKGANSIFDNPISDIGQSLYQLIQTQVSHSYIVNLAVSSSTTTPWGEAANAMFETAVDAGTLTSNTLTIANVAVGNNAGGQNVGLADGQKMRIRAKNTNASSTAMTLAFGSTYDTSGFSVGTIAAGKRAYLDFTYDSDNSKWDLTGYVTGL